MIPDMILSNFLFKFELSWDTFSRLVEFSTIFSLYVTFFLIGVWMTCRSTTEVFTSLRILDENLECCVDWMAAAATKKIHFNHNFYFQILSNVTFFESVLEWPATRVCCRTYPCPGLMRIWWRQTAERRSQAPPNSICISGRVCVFLLIFYSIKKTNWFGEQFLKFFCLFDIWFLKISFPIHNDQFTKEWEKVKK